jgi:hypothetical protein
MIVSERWPLMSRPVAYWRSWERVSPCRLSEPVMSQFDPAEAAGRFG